MIAFYFYSHMLLRLQHVPQVRIGNCLPIYYEIINGKPRTCLFILKND